MKDINKTLMEISKSSKIQERRIREISKISKRHEQKFKKIEDLIYQIDRMYQSIEMIKEFVGIKTEFIAELDYLLETSGIEDASLQYRIDDALDKIDYEIEEKVMFLIREGLDRKYLIATPRWIGKLKRFFEYYGYIIDMYKISEEKGIKKTVAIFFEIKRDAIVIRLDEDEESEKKLIEMFGEEHAKEFIDQFKKQLIKTAKKESKIESISKAKKEIFNKYFPKSEIELEKEPRDEET